MAREGKKTGPLLSYDRTGGERCVVRNVFVVIC